jgi:hypothetical protein
MQSVGLLAPSLHCAQCHSAWQVVDDTAQISGTGVGGPVPGVGSKVGASGVGVVGDGVGAVGSGVGVIGDGVGVVGDGVGLGRQPEPRHRPPSQ